MRYTAFNLLFQAALVAVQVGILWVDPTQPLTNITINVACLCIAVVLAVTELRAA